jgi:hypothetical protein
MFATNGTSFFVQAKYDGWREAVVTDVCFWHIADNPTAPAVVRFWTKADKQGQLALPASAAIDPSATLGVHCGNGCDVGFGPYQSTRLSR